MQFLKPVLCVVLCVVLGCAAGGVFFPRSALAWPICGVGQSPTFHEQFSHADFAVLAKRFSGVEPGGGSKGSTLYEVVQVRRSIATAVQRGDRFTVPQFRDAEKGRFALILGARSKNGSIDWRVPFEVDSVLYNYIVRAPARDADAGERLRYYLSFIDDAIKSIADDAFTEAAAIPLGEIAAHAGDLPRDYLRESLGDPDLPRHRLSLFGLMLGLCGDGHDADLIFEKITEPTDEFPIGHDGLITGYVLLTGEPGLKIIEKLKLHNKEVSFAETYSALQAIRYLWNYGGDRISHARLREALCPLIDRPELSDLVIGDLMRWKDWSLQSRLMELYGVGEYNIPSIKRAIIRYMIASTKDLPAGGETAAPLHAVNGAKNLEDLRRRDPKLVRDSERYFFLQ